MTGGCGGHQIAVAVIGRLLVVDEGAAPSSAVAVVEWLIGHRVDVIHDTGHARLRRVGIVNVGTVVLVAAIADLEAILLVPVCSPKRPAHRNSRFVGNRTLVPAGPPPV